MHRTDTYSQHTSIIWPVWLNDWVFVYELNGCGFDWVFVYELNGCGFDWVFVYELNGCGSNPVPVWFFLG